MHCLIIGGNGRTGKLVVAELLDRGHTVQALVRKTSSMSPRQGLTLVEGTPTNLSDVQTIMAGRQPDPSEIVIVTLNAPRATDSPFGKVISPPRLMADSVANVLASMKKFHMKKIIVLQPYGVGESWVNMHWILRFLVTHSNTVYQYDDHNAVAEEIRGSGLSFVMLRPSRLTEGSKEKIKFWPDAGKGVPLMAGITRASVAVGLVDAAERKDWDNTAPVITN